MKFLVPLAAAAAMAPTASSEKEPEWATVIKSSFNADAGTTYESCTLSESETCAFGDLPQGKTTMIYPGGETRCIKGDEFAFQVIPGASDKLIISFQSGGACWDETSTNIGACTSTASPDWQSGIFDVTDERNPYREYTSIHVMYCSGDLHAGNVTRDYTDGQGNPIVQVGAYNTAATLNWALNNMDATLSSLLITGQSAGSLGTQVWAEPILKMFQYEAAAVVPDSYMGIFPDGAQEFLIPNYGMCTNPYISSDLVALCNEGKLTVQTVFDHGIRAFPNVAWAHINSKFDAVQLAFYSGIAVTLKMLPLHLSESEFNDKMNEVLELYNQNKNYVSYLVTSAMHTYTELSVFFTADTTGAVGRGKGGQTLMSDWLSGFPVPSGRTVASECDGELLDRGAWTGKGYCDSEQHGKTFTPA